MSDTTEHPVIAPEDIRPGDVVRISRDVEVRSVIVSDFAPGGLLITDVKANHYNSAGATLRLVHRPNPDAEVIKVLRRAHRLTTAADDYATTLSNIRRLGFDVIKMVDRSAGTQDGGSGAEREWHCVDCGRRFAEYINGCPHHGDVEIAPHVVSGLGRECDE